MSIESGSFGFRKLLVAGQAPKLATEGLLEQFSNKLLIEDDSAPQVTYGWCGIGHLHDRELSFAKNVFNNCIVLNLRIDTNKVPSTLVKAQKAFESDILAKGNPSGFISKKQKREVKETVDRWSDEQVRSKRHIKHKLIEVVWDLDKGCLYTQVKGNSLEILQELFERTTGLALITQTAGLIASHVASEDAIFLDALKDIQKSRFATPIAGIPAEYPWTAKGANSHDFLGNEFMMWLLYSVAKGETPIPTLLSEGPYRNVDLMVDKTLRLECSYGNSGQDTMKATGPDRMPEVKTALRSGKVPRQFGVSAVIADSIYAFTFDAENMIFGGTRLPEIENADSPRQLTEERITHVRDLSEAFYQLYRAFIHLRLHPSVWDNIKTKIVNWIKE